MWKLRKLVFLYEVHHRKRKESLAFSWEKTFISVVSPSHALSVVSGQIMCYARIVQYGVQYQSALLLIGREDAKV